MVCGNPAFGVDCSAATKDHSHCLKSLTRNWSVETSEQVLVDLPGLEPARGVLMRKKCAAGLPGEPCAPVSEGSRPVPKADALPGPGVLLRF